MLYPAYTYYPRWHRAPTWVNQLASTFAGHRAAIDTTVGAAPSNAVLSVLRPELVGMGFEVEDGKTSDGQLARPVFFGENGEPSRQYKIDAYHPELGIALEVEAGRAVQGNAIYRDIVQMALLVDVDYAVVAIPLAYRYDSGGKARPTEPYRHCVSILDAIYGGRRLALPFSGFLLLGY